MDDVLGRELLRAMPDALWLLDLDGSTLYGNERLAALLGRPVEELSAASIFEVTDERGRDELAEHLEAMRSGVDGADNEEVLILRPDGTRVWTLVSWAPYVDAAGTLVGYLHRLTEYTERRALRDRLTQRESELEAAQAVAHLGSWSWDVTTDRVSWSTEMHRIYGLDPARFDGSYAAFLARAHPDERAAVAATIEQAMRDSTSYDYEGRIVTPAGETRWVKARGVVDRDEAGAVTRLHGTCQDISDLRRAADDAAESRRRLKLFSSIAEAANRSDALDVALGRAWAALQSVEEWRSLAVWGRSGPHRPPELLHDLSSPHRPPTTRSAVDAVPSWTTGEVSVVASVEPGRRVVWLPVLLAGQTVRLIQLEGEIAWVDDAILGLLGQVSATLSRVAEREQAAVELSAARDAAMAASAHKSAFLATMSHEIRTPMNGVIGLNDLLLRTDLDAHQRHLAEGLRGAGLTLLSLLNDILDLTKIESGTVELDHAPFEVSQVLDQTGIIISAPAQEKQLEVVLTCDPALPSTLVGDRVRLGQVLTNLASNAVKFTEHGEVVVELGLDTSPGSPADSRGGGPTSGTILLRGEVRDTGIGIGADASFLFEAFTQADHSTTRNHGGTGLGLAISRRLIQDMGGSIGAEERPDGGSTFWFVAPIEVASAADEEPEMPTFPRARVLVLDDNASAAAALGRQLRHWGLDVLAVHSAAEALSSLQEAAGTEGAFRLVLVDQHMPKADGLTFAREVQARTTLRDLTLLLLSDDPSTCLEDVAALGFADIVDKPLRVAALREAVRRALTAPGSRVAARPPAPFVTDDALSLHVLVVEDNPINQLVAQGLLERLGCTSTVAANGEEAVAALEPGHEFDLVLMDCRMPRMDGYTATKVVRARESGARRVPIVAMTASALEGERDRCLAAGMDDFLTKPVDATSLTRVVGSWAAGTPLAAAAATLPTPEPEPEPAAPPVLDLERVEMLGELVRDGINFFDRTRASFLLRIDATMVAVRTAQDRRDLLEAGAVAHQLRGSALNLGLARVGAAAARVERAAAADDLGAVSAAVDDLEATVAEGVQALGRVPAAQPAS